MDVPTLPVEMMAVATRPDAADEVKPIAIGVTPRTTEHRQRQRAVPADRNKLTAEVYIPTCPRDAKASPVRKLQRHGSAFDEGALALECVHVDGGMRFDPLRG